MWIFGCSAICLCVRVVSKSAMFAAVIAACFASALSAAAAKSSALHPTGHPMESSTGGNIAAVPQIESTSAPNFGPNVYIFTPGMPQSEIQATVDSIATQQVSPTNSELSVMRCCLSSEPMDPATIRSIFRLATARW